MQERAVFAAGLEPDHEPLPRPAEAGLGRGGGHDYPLQVRWSDLDSYGHANNVKYYDYIQEARVALMSQALRWLERDSPSADDSGWWSARTWTTGARSTSGSSRTG